MVNIKENKSYGLSEFFTKVYLWMFIGLLVSGVVAYYASITQPIIKFVYSNFGFILILELVVVIALNLLRSKVSPEIAKVLFLIYSAVSGLTLSSVFIIYKLGSILTIFLSAALMFALLAAYGYITKRDLSSFGKIMVFGLLAIIIMSIINIFVKNANFNLFLCIISIVVFLGITAWDMNNLKKLYNYYATDEKELSKIAIYGALDLYLDFINIFLNLLQLFGKEND